MVGNLILIHFCNIAIRLFTKIGKISLLAVLVPFIGIDTMPSGTVEGDIGGIHFRAHAYDSLLVKISEIEPIVIGKDSREHSPLCHHSLKFRLEAARAPGRSTLLHTLPKGLSLLENLSF